MKVRSSVKPICEKCKVIKRKGSIRIICESVRIRNTSRDRANCSCLFALSLCAAAVEHQDELFALLSYETAGIAAFLRLHTEDAGENHPEYERIARAHISGRRTTELPQQILERKKS